jgi:Arm DNA-binding domain
MTSNAVSASVCEGGSKKYVVHYRQAGIQRRHTIGSVANLTLVEARKRARKILVAVDDGRDPAAEKESKRAASGLVFGSSHGRLPRRVRKDVKTKNSSRIQRRSQKAMEAPPQAGLGCRQPSRDRCPPADHR